jgi:prolyl 4-hydroxylase
VRARVYDAASKTDVVSQARTNTAAGFNLMETDLVHLMVQTRISAASGLPVANMEGATVLHYDVGEEIANHYDFVDPSIPDYQEEVRTRGERIMTFLVYLNDDYGGGETDFPRLGVRHKGRRGEGLYFINALPSGEPDRRSWHAGQPPVSGEKWILSQFIRNRRVLQL